MTCQDIGNFRIKNLLFCDLIKWEQIRKRYTVFICNKNENLHAPWEQYESMARIYMNRFAIDEEDQFEIHVKNYSYQYDAETEEMYNAAEKVMLKAQEGLVFLFKGSGV